MRRPSRFPSCSRMRRSSPCWPIRPSRWSTRSRATPDRHGGSAPVPFASPMSRPRGESRVPADLSATLLVSDAPGAVDQARLAEALRISLSAAGISLQVRTENPQLAAQISQAGDHEMLLTEAQVMGGDPHLLLYPLSA